MRIKLKNRVIHIINFRVRIYTDIGEGKRSVKDYPFNPLWYVRQRIIKWHTDWAMQRLKTKKCTKCGEPWLSKNI